MPKGTRTTGRLGWGEYQRAGPNQMGRVAFMEAVLRHTPGAFDDLIAIGMQMTGGVEDRLNAWAKKWQLTDVWIGEIARFTLQTRREFEGLRTRGWFYPGWPVMAPSWLELEWDPESGVRSISGEKGGRGWDPEMESEAAFRERIDRHVLRVRAQAEASDFVRVTDKRRPEHFDWLVLHQVKGWTLSKIAERYQDDTGSPDISAVSRAVTKTAALIGLTLRPSRGPRRSANVRRR